MRCPLHLPTVAVQARGDRLDFGLENEPGRWGWYADVAGQGRRRGPFASPTIPTLKGRGKEGFEP